MEGPVDGGFFEWRDTVDYTIKVTDPEDGTIDCNEVLMKIGLGHDEHATRSARRSAAPARS